jgi:outer membrane lipoprotein-sorting protein
MKRLRTVSTRRLLIVVGAAAVLAITAGIAQGALSDDNPVPASKPLNQAIVDAANGPTVDGVTASITFDNHLIPAGALPEGTASPLLSGAKGRLWATNDGRFRIELQSQAGDAQVVSDGKTATLYDASSNTAYTFDIPEERKSDEEKAEKKHEPLTLAQVDKAITEISKHWSLSGANPTSTAGQPTYTVRISPKDDGGLLGAAEVAFDSESGIPLRAAVYADNQDAPVLELKADDISFAQVPESDVDVAAPQGAKVVDMSSRQEKAAGKAKQAHEQGKKDAHQEQSVDEVQSQVGFKLAAPESLAGLPRQAVRTVKHGDDAPAGAVAVYGKGLGAIVVLQQDAKTANEESAKEKDDDGGDRERDLSLPTINIDGASGTELATALGTVITFERDGVSYTVAGSVPPQAAETAARELK